MTSIIVTTCIYNISLFVKNNDEFSSAFIFIIFNCFNDDIGVILLYILPLY